MPYHQPDPSNAPAPSALQQYELFKGRGGNREDFALQTARTRDKIFAIEARSIEESIALAFLGGMFRLNDEDTQKAQAAWIMMGKISRTQHILAGKNISEPQSEIEPNLGIHYVGNH